MGSVAGEGAHFRSKCSAVAHESTEGAGGYENAMAAGADAGAGEYENTDAAEGSGAERGELGRALIGSLILWIALATTLPICPAPTHSSRSISEYAPAFASMVSSSERERERERERELERTRVRARAFALPRIQS